MRSSSYELFNTFDKAADEFCGFFDAENRSVDAQVVFLGGAPFAQSEQIVILGPFPVDAGDFALCRSLADALPRGHLLHTQVERCADEDVNRIHVPEDVV